MAMLKPLVLSLSIALAALGVPAAAESVPAAAVAPDGARDATRQLADLAERYYEAQARFEPIEATFNGDNRFDDLLPMTHVPSVRARQFAMLHAVHAELTGIDRSKLAGADRSTFDILNYELNEQLRMEPFRDYLMPMNHMDSVPVLMANFASGQGSQPLTTPEQYQAYLKRLQALPLWIDAAIANMRIGMRDQVVLPRALVQATLPQVKALAAASVANSDYMAPIRNLPAGFGANERARLRGAYTVAVEQQVLPALRRLASFLERDYLPGARASDGWSALPGGAPWYQAWVAQQTTSTLTPDEIHAIGLAEMARINAELAKLAPRLGYKGAPSGLPRWLSEQAKYRPFKSETEVLDAYRVLNARILPKLSSLFATMPKAPLELRAEPALSRDTASDHYTGAAADGSRPGIFWAVIADPAKYASTKMVALFLHEGNPGHHFQLSKQQELPIPKFRKFGGNTAYVEGWALYAETLGKELGLYDDPNAYAGFLMLDMRRAARLVVDTGLHAKGWSRARTIAYLVEEAGHTPDDALNATERYMSLPGQALGYKIGALKILALRERASKALGPKFSLARFHDAVLAEGTLPLGLLEARIDAWIAQQGK